MNFNSCDHGAEYRAEVFGVEILPSGRKPCSLVQKPLLGNRVGPTTLDRIQHCDRIAEPCAYPASNESLDKSGRKSLAPLRPFILSSQYRLGNVVSIPDTLLYHMTRGHQLAMRVVDETSEQA